MGGNAIENTRRLQAEEYKALEKELVEIMISGTADTTSSKNRYQKQRETNENAHFQNDGWPPARNH